MILSCELPGHVRPTGITPEQVLFDCTAPDGMHRVVCLDHAVGLETVGWTTKRIKTEGQRERELEWAGVGVN